MAGTTASAIQRCWQVTSIQCPGHLWELSAASDYLAAPSNSNASFAFWSSTWYCLASSLDCWLGCCGVISAAPPVSTSCLNYLDHDPLLDGMPWAPDPHWWGSAALNKWPFIWNCCITVNSVWVEIPGHLPLDTLCVPCFIKYWQDWAHSEWYGHRMFY